MYIGWCAFFWKACLPNVILIPFTLDYYLPLLRNEISMAYTNTNFTKTTSKKPPLGRNRIYITSWNTVPTEVHYVWTTADNNRDHINAKSVYVKRKPLLWIVCTLVPPPLPSHLVSISRWTTTPIAEAAVTVGATVAAVAWTTTSPTPRTLPSKMFSPWRWSWDRPWWIRAGTSRWPWPWPWPWSIDIMPFCHPMNPISSWRWYSSRRGCTMGARGYTTIIHGVCTTISGMSNICPALPDGRRGSRKRATRKNNRNIQYGPVELSFVHVRNRWFRIGSIIVKDICRPPVRHDWNPD